MSSKIVVLPEFAKEVKRLAKKYKQIKADLQHLSEALEEDPRTGTALAGNCYKIRLVNSSVPTGKRGGFRVIYYFVDELDGMIYLISIYSKTEQSNISEEKIIDILRSNGLV